jgi:hypothetical protein
LLQDFSGKVKAMNSSSTNQAGRDANASSRFEAERERELSPAQPIGPDRIDDDAPQPAEQGEAHVKIDHAGKMEN